jgi:hypothetical protein
MTYDGTPDGSRAVKEAATAVTDVARDEGRDVAADAKARAGDVAQKTKEQARDVVHDVREEARRRVDDQSTRAAQALHDAGTQLHSMAAAADDDTIGGLADQAARSVDRLASRLDDGGIERVLDDVKAFARRRPGLFLLGAGVAGFMVGRIARNASSALGDDSSSQPSTTTPSTFAQPAFGGLGGASPESSEAPYLGGGTPATMYGEGAP